MAVALLVLRGAEAPHAAIAQIARRATGTVISRVCLVT
jgi:hypothetical protein